MWGFLEKCSVAELEREKANMDGIAYPGLIDPRALRASGAYIPYGGPWASKSE